MTIETPWVTCTNGHKLFKLDHVPEVGEKVEAKYFIWHHAEFDKPVDGNPIPTECPECGGNVMFIVDEIETCPRDATEAH